MPCANVACPCHGLACRVKIIRAVSERVMIDPCQDRSVSCRVNVKCQYRTPMLNVNAECPIWRCLFCIRPAETVWGGVPRKLFGFVAGFWTCPRGLGTALRSIWVDSQDLATILDPFRTIFDDLGPERLSAT